MTATRHRDIELRPGTPTDAPCIGVLATQVFLDTYAPAGIRPDLAREALTLYSTQAFAERLSNPSMEFVLAESAGSLVAFVEVAHGRRCPVAAVTSRVEVVRLYVQRPFQHRGIGRILSARALQAAQRAGENAFWLTAWSGNARALAFYRALGYENVGITHYTIEDQRYENLVLRMSWSPMAT